MALLCQRLAMRAFTADTIALVSLFILAGALNERFMAGLAWDEVLVSRLIGLPLMVLTARPYGLAGLGPGPVPRLGPIARNGRVA